MSLIFGIRITLQDSDDPVTPDTTIGLYNNASSNSQFRWLQNPISGLVDQWNASMIIDKGISKFSREINLRDGGNIASPTTCTVTVHNLQQLFKLFEDKSIFFPGLKYEIVEFIDTTECVIWLGECQSPYYDLHNFTIPAKRTYHNRISNILTKVNSDQFQEASSDTIGKVIPATYGALIPSIASDGTIERPSFAKFIRTLDKEVVDFYSDDYFTGSGFTNTISFPYEGDDMGIMYYDCALRSDAGATINIIYPDNTYVKVVAGTGEGQIRKVSEILYHDYKVTFVIEDYFETELADSGDDRSWCQLFKIYRRYDGDTLPCHSFRDKDNNELLNAAELYTFTDEDGFSRIASYGYEFMGLSTDNNKLSIDPKLFDQGNLDSQNSFLILPVENLQVADISNLDDWGVSDVNSIDTGLYSPSGYEPDTVDTNSTADLDKATDKISSTYFDSSVECTFSSSCTVYRLLTFDLPKLPKGFSFSECYIGIKLKNTITYTFLTVSVGFVYLRKFKYSIETLTLLSSNNTQNDRIADNLPDFYFTDNPDTGNENFFTTNTDSDLVTGINNSIFETSITSKDQYESFIQGMFGVVFASIDPGESHTVEMLTSLYDICFIFKKSSDIKTNLFTPLHGRIFDDTFGNRKTSASLITSPIDIFEHICRLQNFNDFGIEQPPLGWGKQLPLPEAGTSYTDFIALGQISRIWFGIAAAPNGDIYACVNNGDIYKQTGGVGDFIALGQTTRFWRFMTASPNGDIYACVGGVDIYKQTNGIGDFIAISAGALQWRGLAAAPNGDIYASVYSGDIYKQTGGVGAFNALSQTLRNWVGLAAAPNGDIYACVSGGDIYKQTGGVGDFIALGQTLRNWRGVAAAPNGDIYACVGSLDIYKQTGGVGDFIAISAGVPDWYAITVDYDGNIYATVYSGDIYKSSLLDSSPTLPIKITGDGSFDATELDDLRDYLPAFQITEFESGYTDVLKRRLCQHFHIANWIDNDGYECLRRIKETTPSPSDLVTLGSITNRNTIKIYELDITSLYVEPFIEYEKNPATDEMINEIRVFNTSATVYNGSYVHGLTGSAAEEIWSLCNGQWQKCKTINKPPSDMTSAIFANGAQSASISVFHLTEWLQHNNLKGVEFEGHYNDFGHWEECHRYMVQFPHHTNNVQHQCIGEVITINPNPPFDVVVKGLMF